jgi:antitoxin PrlF
MIHHNRRQWMLKLFLDALMKSAQDNPDRLTPYTQQMADAMDKLLVGVTVDGDG